MMTPFLKKTSACYFVTVTTKEGAYVRLSTGSRDFDTAVAMQDMLTALGRRGSRNWDVIDWILETNPKTGRAHPGRIARAFDFYPERLTDLRAEVISNADLAAAIDAWEANLDVRVASGTLAESTAVHYRRQVAFVFPKDDNGARQPVRRSSLTKAFFVAQLARIGGSGTSKRRHAGAWTSCLLALVEAGHLERNPLDDVTLPKNNKTKTPHIERLEDVLRLVHAMPAGPHRAAAAFREGAGVEIQAIEHARRRDVVDEGNRVVWAHGKKNESRDRQVIVDEWAWAILKAYLDANPMMPDAVLFPRVNADSHRRYHDLACASLRSQGVNIPTRYTPHNARNSYAVRGMKNGRDPVLIANNLGHADTSEVLHRYGKFRPAITDLVRADRRAK